MRRTFLAVAVAFAALFAGPGVARSAQVPPTLSAEAFGQRLFDAERAASDAAALPSPEAMRSVRAIVGLPVRVSFGNGDVLVITEDPFLDALRGATGSDFRAVAEHLAALRDELESAAASVPPDREGARAALVGAYRGVSAQLGWRERIMQAVTDWFRGVLERLTNFSGAGSAIAWVVVAAVLALVIWLLTRLRLVPGRAIREAREREAAAIDWHRVARDALARGDEPEAVRAHYRALLAALARRGVVPDTPSLTAGECRLSVGRFLPGAYSDVARATGIFERVAYGRRALAAGDLDAMRRAEEAARAA